MRNLGNALRVARQAAGVSLSRMAELTNYSKPYLGQLETGRRDVRPEHVTAYEQALDVRIGSEAYVADRVDVDLVRQGTDVLTMFGLRHGGLAVAEMVGRHWDWTNALLAREMRDDVRADLSSQAARVADRLAWSMSDMGRSSVAIRLYKTAGDMAQHDKSVHDAVAVDFANHLTGVGKPGEAIALLDSIRHPSAVIAFTAHSGRARAHAEMGEWRPSVRAIALADEAHANVEVNSLPDTHLPYVSGHAAHAHRDAGHALAILARRGERRAVSPAADRLARAIEAFGPERASAIAKCHHRLLTL